DWVSDSEDESETKAPQIVPSFVQSTEQVKSPRHSVQHVETSILAATPNPASPKPASNGKGRNRKACFVCKILDHLIKVCDYHEKKITQPTARNHAHMVLPLSKPVSITAVRLVSTAVPKIKVTRPKQVQPIVTKPKSPIIRHITRSLSPKTSNSRPRVTAVKASMVSAAQENMSYLFDFEELNGGYVAFGGNPKGGKIFGKGKIKTGKLDFDDVSFVKELKFNLFSVSQMLHMDLFGPTFVKSLNKKSYCLVVTDDYSRSDNGTEFKNNDLNQFCGIKEIKREFSVPRTPQQNGIAEKKNMTLIKAARTMLADSLLSIPFWAEAVNTACYVQNRVLVTKPHNKTPYELLHGRSPSIGFMRPFGCSVTILNTLDFLGKLEGNVDEGFLVRYFVSSKAFRVFNSRTCIVQETLHVNFLENKSSVAGSGPTWLFDIDSLTKTMKYQPINACNQSNPSAGFQDKFATEKAGEEEPEFNAKKPESEVNVSLSSSAQSKKQDDKTKREAKGKRPVESFTRYRDLSAKFEDYSDNNINEVNAAGALLPAVRQISPNNTNTFSAAGPLNAAASPTHRKSSSIDASQLPDDPDIPELEDITYSDDEDDVGVEVDFNNLETSITVSPIPTTRVHKDHHEELLQFKMQKVWVLVDLPYGKRAIGFEDPDHPDKVCKLVKALYGLHQALRAWYETLANYLLENDDIIFGTTNKDLCKSFEKLMKDKFQMSSMGELTFFFGLQVKQKKDGIFISQDKYVAEILRKFRLTDTKSDSTPIDTEKPLLKDLDVKRIFRYLKGKSHLGLWYPKDSPFDLVAYSDSDYAGASLDRKSTTGECQLLGCRLVSWQCKKQTVVATSSTEAEYVATAS
nr:hypothetical protein [Tanacetum cinerariifolium]